MTSYSSALEQGEIHDILRNDRRRRIIKYLRDMDETISVSHLSEHIASLETGETPPPRDVRKSVYVSLHQTHLPKLDDWGIIEYDYRSKELTLLDKAEEVEVYMEIVGANNIPWGTYYLGISLLALVTFTATELNLLFIAELGLEFWSWFYVLVVALSAGFQTLSAQKRRISL